MAIDMERAVIALIIRGLNLQLSNCEMASSDLAREIVSLHTPNRRRNEAKIQRAALMSKIAWLHRTIESLGSERFRPIAFEVLGSMQNAGMLPGIHQDAA
jgi:hypothetical protein